MNRNVILTCAVTGAGDTTDKNQNVPVTPKAIAEAAIEAGKAGASIAHLHVRDPETGGVSHSVDHFREVVERIRESDTDIVINLTAGGGGDWTPDAQDPTRGGPGTDIQTPAERHEAIGELLPEMCTLDCGSLNFGDMVYVNTADWLRIFAGRAIGSGLFRSDTAGPLSERSELLAPPDLSRPEPMVAVCQRSRARQPGPRQGAL